MAEGVLRLFEQPFELIFAVFVFSVLRMLGLTFSFVVFGWGLGSGPMMRVNISVILSLPVMVAQFESISTMAETKGVLEIVLLAAKEFALGFGLGLLASSPFRAFQHAGGIIDTFRGESDSGIQGPDQNPLQTLSMFYLIIAFVTFFSLGGLWQLVEVLYGTFDIWPITERAPFLYEGSAKLALDALSTALRLAFIIAAPTLILLFTVEIVLMGANKLGKRFHLYELSFLLRNLVTILTLPLMTIVILRVAEVYVPGSILSLEVMRSYFE